MRRQLSACSSATAPASSGPPVRNRGNAIRTDPFTVGRGCTAARNTRSDRTLGAARPHRPPGFARGRAGHPRTRRTHPCPRLRGSRTVGAGTARLGVRPD
ncbi:hypothetical protein GCM10025734_12270 [Kitasatospora paranensis]